ncbi:MAG TPA: hypothetical protein PKD70_11470 [Saprospiraceae bacterium]|nr:hypothetical protein [Saprospiraceae bacterium]
MSAKVDMHLPVEPEGWYHIFNRGNGGQRIFFRNENYRFFLARYAHYMNSYWDTYAYCLLPNHFHIAIRAKSIADILAAAMQDFTVVDRTFVRAVREDLPNLEDLANLAEGTLDLRNLADFVNLASDHAALRQRLAAWIVRERFRRFLLSYAKAINQQQGRSGSLLQKIFRRRAITTEGHLTTLIAYIHRNPLHHGITPDWEQYPWSSYRSFLSEQPTNLKRDEVLGWFEGTSAFVHAHRQYTADWRMIQPLLMEE